MLEVSNSADEELHGMEAELERAIQKNIPQGLWEGYYEHDKDL